MAWFPTRRSAASVGRIAAWWPGGSLFVVGGASSRLLSILLLVAVLGGAAALAVSVTPSRSPPQPSNGGEGSQPAEQGYPSRAGKEGSTGPGDGPSPPPPHPPAILTTESMGMTITRHNRVVQYHFDSTASTQDAAKQLLQDPASALYKTVSASQSIKQAQAQVLEAAVVAVASTPFDSVSLLASSPPPPRRWVVTATEQTSGRGTHQRQWWGKPGNAFATAAIPQSDWSASGLPLTLLPLLVGVLVARRLQSLFDHHPACHSTSASSPSPSPQITLKWPNDVLVDGRKIAGILIESSTLPIAPYEQWFLVGIGINVAWAPNVPSSGTDRGRPSVSLVAHCPGLQSREDGGEERDGASDMKDCLDPAVPQLAQQLGVDLAEDLVAWLLEAAAADGRQTGRIPFQQQLLLEEWRGWVDWDAPLVVRGDGPESAATTAEVVQPQEILPDGTLRVVGGDGTSRTMVSDYFF